MKYYQVKPDADQRRKPGKIFDFYIANELYTEKEVTRQKLNLDYLRPVNAPKNKSYFFFGARFNNYIR